jgi:hypothetical protein
MRLFTERPGTTIAFHAVPSEAVVQMVLTQECDLGLVSVAVPRPGLKTGLTPNWDPWVMRELAHVPARPTGRAGA